MLEVRRIYRGRGYRAELGPIDAEGRTKTEARENLMLAVYRALTADYTPWVVVAHGWVGIVWRGPRGWRYTLRHIEAVASGAQVYETCLCGDSRDDAIRRCLYHLIQNVGPEALHLADGDTALRLQLERYFELVQDQANEVAR